MLFRLFISLLLFTALTSEGAYLPVQVFSYFEQDYGAGLFVGKAQEKASLSAASEDSAFTCVSFSGIKGGIKQKKEGSFNFIFLPVHNEPTLSAPTVQLTSALPPAAVKRYRGAEILSGSDNSPPALYL